MVFDVFRQKPSAGQELDAKQSFDPAANPYKARHPWPPNFSAMSAQQRFALEKKHSRRSKMVGLRESRVKKVKIAQWTICGGKLALFSQLVDGDVLAGWLGPRCADGIAAVVVYFVLFHEEDNPRNHPRAEELFGGVSLLHQIWPLYVGC